MLQDTKNVKYFAARSIVLADDDVDDHIIFQDALQQVDPTITLTIVRNGNEVMDLLTLYAPDMVFLDLDMPGKNGLECLKEIRQNPVYQNLPLIVYSSTSRQNNIDVAYEMGANLFFIKSVDYSSLVAAISSILSFDWRVPSLVTCQYKTDENYLPYKAEVVEK